ncbi:hypothetical protein [Mycobacterium colombiense]|uniref:hypothetical protein n=1 Tax=Mycobacterium colombiense TaxID=339268 RepID=UPI001402EA71|nr:hypothetical protein [Mycobacterium colombiense]
MVGIPQNNIWGIVAGRRRYVLASTAAKILSVPIPDVPWKIANDGCPVPAVGTQRRLQALHAIGYQGRHLAELLGVEHSVVTAITSSRQPGVNAKTARAVARLFNELQMTQGPSKESRRRAAARGWVVPLAWDEDSIDDPAASPQMPEDDSSAWYEDYCELKEIGLDDTQIAERMGIQRSSLLHRLRRRSHELQGRSLARPSGLQGDASEPFLPAAGM